MVFSVFKSSRNTSVQVASVFFFAGFAYRLYSGDIHCFCDIFHFEFLMQVILLYHMAPISLISSVYKWLSGSGFDYHAVIICGAFVAPFLKSETIFIFKQYFFCFLNSLFLFNEI